MGWKGWGKIFLWIHSYPADFHQNATLSDAPYPTVTSNLKSL